MKKNLPKFLYGFLSSSVDPINMAMPWQPSDRDGLFKMNRTVSSAERDSLIFWAHTNKGERVYDFEFGLDARRSLFEPEPLAKESMLNNARRQLPKYFPHLTIDKLEFFTSSEDNSLSPNSVRMILIARPKGQESVINIDEVLSN